MLMNVCLREREWVCSGVSVGLGAELREREREESAPGQCGRQRAGQSSVRGALNC